MQEVALYLEFLEMEKGLAQNTILAYERDLIAFFDYFGGEIENISRQNINSYIYYLKEKKYTATSVARKIASIRGFYRWVCVSGLLKQNPTEFLEQQKLPKKLPKVLTADEMNKIFAQNLDLAQKVIVELLYGCGLRVSELVGINISHLKDDNTLVVLGKGNKERTIYLNNACINAISAYMAVRPVDGVIDRDALFISNQKKRISKQSVQKMVEANLKKCGFDGMGLSTHKLRHTAATLMYQHGNVDPLQLKEILGHENLSTTEIYTHIRDEQLKQAVDSNPLNNPSNLKKSRK